MIKAVRGKLEYMGVDSVVIEVGGVSLGVFVPTTLVGELGDIGSEVKLYTHFLVREDNMALYGFKQQAELDLFELLIGVSGVGPKAALGMISTAGVETVHLAIAQGNIDVLKKVPGIGPKTAGRIILELKGRLVDTASSSKAIAASVSANGKTNGVALERMQVIEALAGLGYTPAEVQNALASLPPSDPPLTIEEQVLAALRFLGQ